MIPKSPTVIGETIKFIKSGIEENEKGDSFVSTITLKSTGEFIGGCGIHKIKTSTPGVGIWVKESAHGNIRT